LVVNELLSREELVELAVKVVVVLVEKADAPPRSIGLSSRAMEEPGCIWCMTPLRS